MQQPIITTRDLCKTYVSGKVQLHAVRNANLVIREQEFTVIMGSSGSGKSTLLYLLSGLDSATAGSVNFAGTDLHVQSEKQAARFRRGNVGFVFQAINLVPNLSLLDNVVISGYLRRQSRTQVRLRALQLLREMDLADAAVRLPTQVSGGQQQRAAIARALVNQPAVLFADEPTGSLNSAQGQKVLDILSRINRSGQTIVMVTHDIKAACRADRILFIKDGRISGEMTQSPFQAEQTDAREKEVFRFLTDRGW